jgi:hypothetical protein
VGRGGSVESFVTILRWGTAVFAVAGGIAVVVLALRAPDCIAIGVSVLRAEDCTNRDTYYLLLVASATATVFFSLLLLASAHALELLAVIARRRGVSEN